MSMNKEALGGLEDWFREVVSSLAERLTLRCERSPEGQIPQCLALHLDSDVRLATVQIWSSGDIFLQCLDAETDVIVTQESKSGAAEAEIRELLAQLPSIVLRK